MTRFTIVIPCFNSEAHLPQTLRAILAQSYEDYEVICVEDGSSDSTTDIIKSFASLDRRVRLVQNDGKGPSRARNYGALQLAIGEIIAFCDADDIWAETKLKNLANEFADAKVDAVYGQIAFFDKRLDQVSTVSTVPEGPLSIPMLLGENPVCTMSNISVRRAIFARTGGFDETMVHNEDLDWLIRLVGQGAKVVGQNIRHTYYRTNQGGLSSDLAAMQKGRAMALKTAARYGHTPSAAADAVYYRYLARRALRLRQGRFQALAFASKGVCRSPSGFFASPRRGLLTLFGALLSPVLPTRLSRALFG